MVADIRNAVDAFGSDYRGRSRALRCDSAAEADRVFSMLMGDEVAPRREFIESHAKYAKLDI